MGQRKFQISKDVQGRNLIREIRAFLVPIEISSTFSASNGISMGLVQGLRPVRKIRVF